MTHFVQFIFGVVINTTVFKNLIIKFRKLTAASPGVLDYEHSERVPTEHL